MNLKTAIITIFLCTPILLTAQDFSFAIGGDFIPKIKAAGIRRNIGVHADFTYLESQRVGFVASIGWNREALFSQGQSSKLGEKYAVIDLNAGDNSFLDGTFSLLWLELSPQVVLYRHIKKDIAFNLGVGVGIYFAKNSWTWEVKNNLHQTAIENGVYYEEDPIRPNFGYNVRASFDFPMTRQSRLRFESKYLIYRPSVDYKIFIDTTHQTIEDTRRFELDALYLSIALVISI